MLDPRERKIIGKIKYLCVTCTGKTPGCIDARNVRRLFRKDEDITSQRIGQKLKKFSDLGLLEVYSRKRCHVTYEIVKKHWNKDLKEIEEIVERGEKLN